MTRIFLTFLICLTGILFSNISYADNVSMPSVSAGCNNKFHECDFYSFSGMSGLHIDELRSKEMKLKVTVPFKTVTLEKGVNDSSRSKYEKRAVWAKRLGIGSLISIFIPVVNVLSLPAAIVAIILGTSSIKKVKNKKNARQGITFGIITTAIAVLIIGIVVLVVSLGGVK